MEKLPPELDAETLKQRGDALVKYLDTPPEDGGPQLPDPSQDETTARNWPRPLDTRNCSDG